MTSPPRWWTGLLAALVVATSPIVAHADAPGPTDYRTDIVAVTPPTDAFTVSIEGGDSFVLIEVVAGHDVTVLGYDNEPYLRILDDGTVEQNRLSFATYYNEERFGGTDVPGFVDNEAEPDWERVGDGGRWAWHDHRAHWMGDEPPIGLAPGESLPEQEIPLLVDGEPVAVVVATTLLETPRAWPAALGVIVGIGVVTWAVLARRSAIAVLVVGVPAVVAGASQYLSQPSETGPLLTWWLLPVLAVVVASVGVGIRSRQAMLSSALAGLGALQLLVWAWPRSDGLTAAILPTDLPYWFDRMVTSTAMTAGLGLFVVAVVEMFRPVRRQRAVAPAVS